MQLNKWVWIEAVRQFGRSSGSLENSKVASGQGDQANVIVLCCMRSAEESIEL